MKIKVCGLTSVAQLQQVQAMGIDYAGLIFYERSARYASPKLESDQQAVRAVPIRKVGVFVNATAERVHREVAAYGLWAVQLHGEESPDFCKALMDKVTVIKVFRMGTEAAVDRLVAPFADACHYYLFDTDTAGYGGSGRQFNWGVLEAAAIGKPFILSGGIGPEDVQKVGSFHHPLFHAIDVNSRFETAPGVKDIDKIQQLLLHLQSVGQQR